MLQLKLDGCMLGINNRDLGTFKVDLHNNKVIMDSPAGQQVPHSTLLSGQPGNILGFSLNRRRKGQSFLFHHIPYHALLPLACIYVQRVWFIGFSVCELCVSAAVSCLGMHFAACLRQHARKWQHVTQPLRATILSSTSKGCAAQACCSLCYGNL